MKRLLLLVLLAACSKPSQQPLAFAPGMNATEGPPIRRSVTLSQHQAPSTSNAPATETRMAEGMPPIALCPRGLCLIDPNNGQATAYLTQRSAEAAAFSADRNAVLYYVASTREVRRYTLASQQDEAVVSLADQTASCSEEPSESNALHASGPDAFVVDARGDTLCMTLDDGHGKAVALRVSLRHQRVTDAEREHCSGLQESSTLRLCQESANTYERSLAQAQDTRRFIVTEHGIIDRSAGDERVVGHMANGWTIESSTPSWSLLSGNAECDTARCDRQLALFETSTGQIYPLPDLSGATPGTIAPFASPISAARLGDGRYAGVSASAHSTVTWLDAETLVVDRLLVHAGREILVLAGIPVIE